MFLNQDSNFVLRAKLTNAAATSQAMISVSYHDNTDTYHPDAIVSTNDTTPVVLLAAPSGGLVNIVETIKIYNPDSKANTVEILAGDTVIYACSIGSKESLVLSEEANITITSTGGSSGGSGGAVQIGSCSTASYDATLTGTVTTTSGSATVTGSSTFFTTELSAGQTIVINGTPCVVSSIASNTSLTLAQTYANTTGTYTAYKANSEKTVTISNYVEADGSTFIVNFTDANFSLTPKLNINSGTAKNIYSEDGTVVSATNPAYFPAGSKVEFMYSSSLEGYIYKNRPITNYSNGTSGYKVWANGYKEQWGIWDYGSYAADISTTINFLLSFKNVNYQIFITRSHLNTNAPGSAGELQTANGTISSVLIAWFRYAETCFSRYINWKVEGY